MILADAHRDTRHWVGQAELGKDEVGRPAAAFLNKQVSARRDLDWLWLPSEHLRNPWPGARRRKTRVRFEGSTLLGDGSSEIEDVRL